MEKDTLISLYRTGDYRTRTILRALSTDRFYRLLGTALATNEPESRTIALEDLRTNLPEDLSTAV